MKIKNLRKDICDGWSFDIILDTDSVGIAKTYFTNDHGAGLFLYASNGNIIQQAGTMQFKLTRNKRYNYEKIRKYFEFYEQIEAGK